MPGAAPTDALVSDEEALSTAASLRKAGKLHQAIEGLHAHNQRSRDPKLSRRLVRYRHELFDVLEKTSTVETWPRSLPDPFGPLDGPPEISRDELTTEVLGGAIVNHGCLLVRGLVQGDGLDRLVHDVDRSLAAANDWMLGAPAKQTSPWFEIFKPEPEWSVGLSRQWVVEGGGVLAADSPIAMFDLIDTMRDAGLGPVLRDYLGERPAVSAKKCTLRRVPHDSGTDWHQDGAFLGEGIRSVNVWLSLSHCGVDAPGLDIVPRRLDLQETGTEGAQFDWSVGRPVVERAAGSVGVVRPVFAPGDALLFDDKFLHATAVGPEMTKPRYAIECWFFAPSCYPGDQVPVVF